ncbi:MAG: hypothetical protein CBB97_21850 [Candidatus Endolissoclinum sp. TMED37]|nr:MAG: hypothetical protein CBB97_21850 [Candidatus Endolissoclinum sp. TMED37]|tara:strand:+ start:132 stop:326 length:195 start_codon:yes stop_codon:yes gene_type:complete
MIKKKKNTVRVSAIDGDKLDLYTDICIPNYIDKIKISNYELACSLSRAVHEHFHFKQLITDVFN